MSIQDLDSARAYGRDLLAGDLVRLRPLEERDLAHLERWWNEPEWQAFQQLTVRPRPDGPTQELFRSWSANDGAAAVGFSVESIGSGEFVGHVTLWGVALPARTATLGIIVGPAHMDRGFGTDAVRTIARYGFRSMGVHRIELTVAAFNPRGRRAYEKVGFQVEGVRREAAFLDGAFVDEVRMGLLRPDFEAAEAARRVAEQVS
jgi:RimJ/RimL family protein N-acetyltransferase